LAALLFSLLQTLEQWQLNPRLWLTWYLRACAAAGGKAPGDVSAYLPWRLSAEQRRALGAPDDGTGSATDTS
jgi:transposase